MNILKKYFLFKKMLKKHSEYLEKGVFRFDLTNLRAFYLIKNETAFLPKDTLSTKTKFLAGLLGLFPFRSIKRGSLFQATIVYFNNASSFPEDIKFFDVKKRKVVTIYLSKERFDLVRQKYINASKIFSSNKKEFDVDNMIVLEKFISSFAKEKDVASLYNLIAFYCDNIIVESNKEANKYFQHGDLSLDNFSFDLKNNGFVFIDFDWFGLYSPFYDIFFLIFNSSYYGFGLFLNELNLGKIDQLFGSLDIVELLQQFKNDIARRTNLYNDMIDYSISEAIKRKNN